MNTLWIILGIVGYVGIANQTFVSGFRESRREGDMHGSAFIVCLLWPLAFILSILLAVAMFLGVDEWFDKAKLRLTNKTKGAKA